MRTYLFFAIILYLFIACSTSSYLKVENAIVQKDSIRNRLSFELCEIYGLDQGIRTQNFSLPYKHQIDVDSICFIKTIKFIRKNGYPNEKLLGKDNLKHECVEGASFAVLLHNPQRIINDKEILHLLIQETDKGNMNKKTLPLILDKYYLAKKGNGQRLYYGSQFGKPCIEDRKKSDSLRLEINLPPLNIEDFKNCKK